MQTKTVFIAAIVLVCAVTIGVNSLRLPQEKAPSAVLSSEDSADFRKWVVFMGKEHGMIWQNSTEARLSESLLCKVCQHIVGDFISFAEDKGCEAAKPVAEKLCDLAKLLKDLCVDLLEKACTYLIELVVKHHVENPKELCHAAHMCSRP